MKQWVRAVVSSARWRIVTTIVTTDDEDFVDWAGSYQHDLGLHQDLERRLQDVA